MHFLFLRSLLFLFQIRITQFLKMLILSNFVGLFLQYDLCNVQSWQFYLEQHPSPKTLPSSLVTPVGK